MSNYAISLKRMSILLATVAFMAVLLATNFLSIFSAHAGAAQLAERSMTMASSLPGTSTTGAANSETNGSDTRHTFTFDVATTGNVGGIRFQYCTTAIGTPCTMPTDLDITGATLTTQTNLDGGFVIDAAAAGVIDIEDASPTSVSAATAVTVAFTDIENPSTTGTFFVRITTYSDTAGGTAVDNGTVATSTTTGIAITSKVVETLGFSTRAVAANGDLGDENAVTSCDALSGSGAIALGDATEGTLAINLTYDAWSAFRLYTNSANGVSVQYAGNTLTKGTDVIDAIGAAPLDSAVGTEQFGLGIDTTANAAGIANADTTFGGAGQLALNATYGNADGSITDGGDAEFAFVAGSTPQEIAESVSNSSFYVDCDSAVVRYIANISPLTPAGTYTTTVVYFAVPEY